MSDSQQPSSELCPACGAAVGGRAACQSAFDSLTARSYTNRGRGTMHNMLVDTYAMQHPEEYGESAKSYIRHLFALACLLERPGDARLYWATPRKGAPVPAPPKPPLLPEKARGTRTVVDVLGIENDQAFHDAVRVWAANVWAAYAPQHRLARDYMTAVRVAIG